MAGTERLHGRRVLVTGASSGIGAAVARAVVGAGGSVALLARSASALATLADELGERAVATPADVTDVAALDAAVAAAVDALGGLDGIVNSAGLAVPDSIVTGDPDGWRAMFDVNVLGLLQATRAVVPHLRRADGPADVVNISSMSGRRRPSVAMTVYAGTKFAVHTISDGMREELRDDGVRVTVVSPGFVVTPIFDGPDDDAERARYREAMRARGLPADVVADHVVHALAQPVGIEVVEVALLSTEQG